MQEAVSLGLSASPVGAVAKGKHGCLCDGRWRSVSDDIELRVRCDEQGEESKGLRMWQAAEDTWEETLTFDGVEKRDEGVRIASGELE